MSDWTDELNSYLMLFPETPALAFDFMSSGMPGATGAVPAGFVQGSPTTYDIYPTSDAEG